MVATTRLISGSDYLGRYPNFRLIGRDDDLRGLSSILIRSKANSVLLSGHAGVGTTALCLGLQGLKSDPLCPFDIVEKHIFWLDTDGLFSSGDPVQIKGDFDLSIRTLAATPESVLIIEDTRDFIEASRASGNQHFINAITQAVKSNKTQVILETRDSDLEFVLKWHSDIRESYTLLDLSEPSPEHLGAILTGIAGNLEAAHRIRISPAAIQKAIDLTSKYTVDDGGLSRAQPDRSATLLDRALASLRLEAHRCPPSITRIKRELETAVEPDLTRLTVELREKTAIWEMSQTDIKKLYAAQRAGEKRVAEMERERSIQIEKEESAKAARTEALQKGQFPESDTSVQRQSWGAMVAAGGESAAVAELSGRIKVYQDEIGKNRARFDEITARMNAELELGADHVTAEFSRITGIAGDKLNEDDLSILRRLDTDLKARVFGQDDVIQKFVNAVRVAKIGKRNGDKPLASFMFKGPSGVGKTEIAKVATLALLGDEKAILRFDMSEYMEKHAVAKLIGAPPGYELAEAGGILTNAMRKNRRRVILFDEIEKAHPDVFNLLLQVLDDGRLTDNLGRVALFNEAIIICTTNTGQPHYLRTDITFAEADAEANRDLEQTYRPEFLNRFAGRENIIGFHRLELPSIERIVRREITNLDRNYAPQGIATRMSNENLSAFCAQRYDAKMGARGLPGFIVANLEPIIVNHILDSGGQRGTFEFEYITCEGKFWAGFVEAPDAAAA